MPATIYSLDQLRLNAYRVWVCMPFSSTAQDLTPICKSIQWDYDLDQACEKFTLTFVKVADLARIVKALNWIYILGVKTDAVFGIGDKIEPLKFGVIVEGGISSNARGEMTITAYDVMWYLSSNKSSHRLQAETATSFFNRMATMYNFPLGHVEETGIKIGPEPFFEKTLYDMIVTSLARTRDIAFQQRLKDYPNQDPTKIPISARGPRFYIRVQYNKIGLLRKQDPTYIWKFDTTNLLSSQSKWSAANYRNVVRVYRRMNYNQTSTDSNQWMTEGSDAGDGDIQILGQWPPTKDLPNDDIKLNGWLAETVTLTGAVDENLDITDAAGQANLQAQETYARLHRIQLGGTISAVNINTLGPGDPIYVEEIVSGLVGKFYIKSGQHKVTASEASMNLTLNLEDVLPEVYKSQPEKVSTLINGAAGGGIGELLAT